MKKYKNIIFDFGNVLATFDMNDLLIRCFGRCDQALKNCIFFDWNGFDEGKYSNEEYVQNVLNHVSKDDYDAIIHFFNTWFRVLQPIDEMLVWIDELKNQGYHLYILSNAPVIFEEYVTNYSFVKLFDGSVFSGSIKIAKPDSKIYQYLMDKYQLNKEECLFIDDKLENVEASREFGMDAIVYHNNLEEIMNIVKGSN
ncbi:MAG: HAD family phosphatase [Erysipelotrichaceae bacterium]|nr:HAD family phosphatase [Erysipelotrichaceae bacterium]